MPPPHAQGHHAGHAGHGHPGHAGHSFRGGGWGWPGALGYGSGYGLAWPYAPAYSYSYASPTAAFAIPEGGCPEGYARSLAAPYACEPVGAGREAATAGLAIGAVALLGVIFVAGILLGTRGMS